MKFPKKIELFLVDGDPEGIIIAELSNWDAKLIKIPREELRKSERKDLEQPGVYFLFCKNDDGEDSVYIGEAENIKNRLTEHIRSFNRGEKDYYWNTAVIITSNKLNKTLIRYLENKYVEITKECNRYELLTKTTGTNGVISESDEAIMEEFIENSKITINTLGYKVLQPLVSKKLKNKEDKPDDENKESEKLYLKIKDAYGEAIQSSEGFVLLEGAKISPETVKSTPKVVIELREKYKKEGWIENNFTNTDLVFNSPTQAADFVSGSNVSGPKHWKNKEGKSLNELDS
ncbi:MAG: GIY-YIG nuclease family protein [Methanobrevibacter sp.]|nr:GIY-YIG nuclease family protein [Methanobrevibacter sp.]